MGSVLNCERPQTDTSVDKEEDPKERTFEESLAAAMVKDWMPKADEEKEIPADRILDAPLGVVVVQLARDDEDGTDGIMQIVRANIKKITEEAEKIERARLKRSQIQYFNKFGSFSC